MTNKTDSDHAKNFSFLVGKTIQKVRYLTAQEAEGLGWYSRPLVLFFDDHSFILAQSDDEGNDGGAMYYQEKSSDKDAVIYTL